MNDKFDRNTFESVDFLVESIEAPKIKAGGSSSSNILNRYFTALSKDLSLLTTRVNSVVSRTSRIEKAMSAQSGALLSQLQSVSTKVDAASAYTQILADLYTTTYVSSALTTATINYVFGQATLPVLTTTNLLVQTDVYGNKYVSPEVTWSYLSTPASSLEDISLLDFIYDSEGVFMLRDDDKSWVVDSADSFGWIKLKAPLQFRGMIPNVLEIWPIPAFGLNIISVAYRKSGDPDGTWTSVDLSYVPNYDGTNIVKAGPIRLHLPNEPIVELAIGFDVTSSDVWGIFQLKFMHCEYSSTAVLGIRDPYSRTLGDMILRGKDTVDLTLLPISKSGNQAEITLSSTDSSITPVITSVIVGVS